MTHGALRAIGRRHGTRQPGSRGIVHLARIAFSSRMWPWSCAISMDRSRSIVSGSPSFEHPGLFSGGLPRWPGFGVPVVGAAIGAMVGRRFGRDAVVHGHRGRLRHGGEETHAAGHLRLFVLDHEGDMEASSTVFAAWVTVLKTVDADRARLIQSTLAAAGRLVSVAMITDSRDGSRRSQAASLRRVTPMISAWPSFALERGCEDAVDLQNQPGNVPDDRLRAQRSADAEHTTQLEDPRGRGGRAVCPRSHRRHVGRLPGCDSLRWPRGWRGVVHCPEYVRRWIKAEQDGL
jgi:hypothetical protein